MTIENELTTQLKAAMKSKDTETLQAIRQLKSKVQEAVNDPKFAGEVDDELYRKVIQSYVGSLRKGIAELEAGGERSKELRQRYQREIDLFATWLPQLAGEDETRRLVKAALDELGVRDPKQSGRVMGHLMKSHRARLDASLTRRLVDEVLAAQD